MKTITVEIKNDKALTLLQNLERLHILRIIESKSEPVKQRLSEKFSGSISKETAKKLQKHIKEIRKEWERDIY